MARINRMGNWRRGHRKSFPMNSRAVECGNCHTTTTKAQTVGVHIGHTHHNLNNKTKDTKVYGWDVFKRVCKNGCK